MKKITRNIIVAIVATVVAVLGTGCQSGQMGTILGGSGLVGGAAIATGYKYMKNGTVTSDDVNDIATTGTVLYAIGNIAGDATDKAVIKKDIKKLKKRK
jgi:hypothetical protein